MDGYEINISCFEAFLSQSIEGKFIAHERR